MARKYKYVQTQTLTFDELKNKYNNQVLSTVSSTITNSKQIAEVTKEIFDSVYSIAGTDVSLFNMYLPTATHNVIQSYHQTVSNKAKFEDLYNQFFPKVYANLCNKLMRYVPNPKDVAYDMATDVIMKVYSKSSDVSYFKSYIFRATDNTFIDYTRKHSTKYNVRMSNVFDAASNNKTEVSNSLVLDLINNCKGLSDINKQIFIMKAVNECSHKEIAAKFNITESSSATRFHHARLFLKRKIGKAL